MVTVKGISDDERRRRGWSRGFGASERSGLDCSKEKATAELLDTVGRREDDGGYGYSGEVAAAASAMVEEGEGEAMGEKGGVQGLWGAS